MKIKNYELKGIVDTLFSMSNRTNDIKLRWELSKLSKPYVEMNTLLQQEINKIVAEEGETDEKGNKTLKTDNAHYQELMNCEVEIETALYLSFLAHFNPTMYELIALEKGIAGD